jgi:hypothetical protein
MPFSTLKAKHYQKSSKEGKTPRKTKPTQHISIYWLSMELLDKVLLPTSQMSPLVYTFPTCFWNGNLRRI